MTGPDVASVPCPPALRLVLTGEDRHDDWMDHAACRGMSTTIFFPDDGENAGAAKAVCAVCTVREPCLVEGLKVRTGIFGGLSPKERRAVKRRLRRR